MLISVGCVTPQTPPHPRYGHTHHNTHNTTLPKNRYRAGPTSISKMVGGVQEVVVENEFHLPYTTVTRVSNRVDVLGLCLRVL